MTLSCYVQTDLIAALLIIVVRVGSQVLYQFPLEGLTVIEGARTFPNLQRILLSLTSDNEYKVRLDRLRMQFASAKQSAKVKLWLLF